MNQDHPRISVVTPSFNQREFLEATMRSVLEQGYPNLEYLVADGGSSDGSRELLASYDRQLAWWVSERDGGQAAAVNKGLQRATGDIIGWLNSDDLYCQGALQRVVKFFRDHPDCDAVVGDLEVIDRQGRLVDRKPAVPVTWCRNLYSGCAVPQPATFFTRKALERTGWLDAALHFQMDYEYFLRMQARGVRFGVLRAPLAQFRLHGTSKTVTEYRQKFWRDFAQIQRPYLPWHRPAAALELYRRVMKWLVRTEIYLVRAGTRGFVLPFRNSRARQRALG